MADTSIALLKDIENKWQDPSLSQSEKKRVSEAAAKLAASLQTPGENLLRLTFQWVCHLMISSNLLYFFMHL
jgi:hypothetical protein